MTLFYFFVGVGAVLLLVDLVMWIDKQINPPRR